MQARIARLDTSNLSGYSVPTLRRLAKDMGLSNIARLSKSELVVQLVSEIILANMTLGWGVPEVSHEVLADSGEDKDGYYSSDDEDATVYRFSGSAGGSRAVVQVEDALPQGKLARGRESVRRLSRDYESIHGRAPAAAGNGQRQRQAAAPAAAGNGHGGGGSSGSVDVDADFESLSKLDMSQLQQLCEDIGMDGWAHMRKFEMISALLLDVYEIER